MLFLCLLQVLWPQKTSTNYLCFFFLSLDSTLDFDAAHAKVLATVLEVFAGPADKVYISRVLIAFLISNFVHPGNLFTVCATLPASHPTARSSKDSSGHCFFQLIFTQPFLPLAFIASYLDFFVLL